MSKRKLSEADMVRCLPPNGVDKCRFSTRQPINGPETQRIPSGYLARKDAATLCDDGAASWINRVTIRLCAKDDIPQTDDESCKMGPNVIECNADDRKWAQALTTAWNPALSEVRLGCLRAVLARGI